ncbi:MAG: cyanophycinase [SAR324 cluster bacterium]|nr:cyanophycinase [SAR324 cluster bacterium]MBL7034188.1 cyanophycinase [SAR324 cluster bacterium]
MASPGTKGLQRGYIVPIGGSEEKKREPVILEKFVKLCGGSSARLAIIPTASRLKETGQHYIDIFREIGVDDCVCLPIEKRTDSERKDYLHELNKASGIFVTGGNQLRLSTIMGGTSVAQAIRRRNADGVHFAGTSAGAAIIPEHMIAGGKSGPIPREGGVTFAPGLGLTNKIVVDQHFRQRDRLGRLLSAVAYNPFATGIGIDENTAAFIDPDGLLEVIGTGAITVVDPSELSHSSMGSEKRRTAINLTNIRLHLLTNGAKFDIHSRQVFL